MSLDSIVNVSITKATASITRAGFGTPMILAYHTHNLDLVREYSSLAAMVTDSFTVTEPAYLAAAAVFSQNPKVTKIKIGRRALAPTQIIEITPTDLTANKVHSVTIGGEVATYTADATPLVAEITAGLFTAINLLTGAFTATDNTTEVSIAADVAGVWFAYEDMTPTGNLEDVTADPGIATDLAAITAADDDWYGLIIADAQSGAQIEAAAAYVETVIKLYGADVVDTEILDSGVSDDVGSNLQTSAYARTYSVYHDDNNAFASAAWMGKLFPSDPGSATWKFKTLAGVAAVSMSATDKTDAADKNVNTYTAVAGVNITEEGLSASGEFMDITRGIDWLRARIQERVYSLLINSAKVPYTDAGVDLVKNQLIGQLTEGVTVGLLAVSPAFAVTAPDVADISSVDKIARLLPDVEFTATLAGAIHNIVITGTVSV